MGSFSWLKADKLTKVANIVIDAPFKFLIPREFGGGYIKDYYQDYGNLGTKKNGEPRYDMYELLAFWNANMKYLTYTGHGMPRIATATYDGSIVKDHLKWDGEFPLLKEIDQYTHHNRIIGIDIGCYDDEIDLLKYPLKLVSASFKGTYEECEGRSYGDPEQGFHPTLRR